MKAVGASVPDNIAAVKAARLTCHSQESRTGADHVEMPYSVNHDYTVSVSLFAGVSAFVTICTMCGQ